MTLRAKKSLGQHFLTSPAIARRIVRAGDLKPGETVLEIGPGKGILTTALLEAGVKVVAVEKDARAILILKQRFRDVIEDGTLSLICGDILNLKPQKLGFVKVHSYKVIANIPYYITGAIIRHFLEAKTKPESMVLLLQKEVADRIAKSKKGSLLSISVRIYGVPTYVETISARFFKPQPKVDSAILKIAHISYPFRDVSAQKHFFLMLHLGFAQKRKMLLGNLSKKFRRDTLQAIFNELQIPENIRAEDISFPVWKKLSERLMALDSKA